MVLKELALLGLGAVVATPVVGVATANRVMMGMQNMGAELPFSPHKHHYSVEEFEERGEFSFTYYYDPFAGAFNRVAMKQIEALEAKGYTVHLRPHIEWLQKQLHRPERQSDFAIVHSLFFARDQTPRTLRWLKKHHRYIIGCEVADTTRISDGYAKIANDPRIHCIFLPSTFAVETYRRSGVQNKLWLVPHGVDALFGKPPHEIETDQQILQSLREDERFKILFFGLHSVETRKGGDVVRKVCKRLVEKGRKFLLVVKTYSGAMAWDTRRFLGSDIPHVRVNKWFSREEDLIFLYDSCDLLLHPYRAGAFELNPFEALARGLPTVVTGWGGVTDYANIHNAYLISPKSAVKVFPPTFYGHVGYGVNPDVDHTVELVEFVMDNRDYCKKKAEKQRGEFVQRSWDKVIDHFLEGCREVWEIA